MASVNIRHYAEAPARIMDARCALTRMDRLAAGDCRSRLVVVAIDAQLRLHKGSFRL